MAVQGFNRFGPDATWATITSVNTTQRQIQAQLQDGGGIYIELTTIPSTFRWPVIGEVWTINRDALNPNAWSLGHRIQGAVGKNVGGGAVVTDEDMPIHTLAPGDLRLDSQHIFDGNGYRRAPVYVQTDAPEAAGAYVWIELDNPVGGWTIWYEDGADE
jgi:hypothetical protein